MTQTFEKAVYLISLLTNLKSWFIVCYPNSVNKANKVHIFKNIIYYSQLSYVFLILKLNILDIKLQNTVFRNSFQCINKISYWLHQSRCSELLRHLYGARHRAISSYFIFCLAHFVSGTFQYHTKRKKASMFHFISVITVLIHIRITVFIWRCYVGGDEEPKEPSLFLFFPCVVTGHIGAYLEEGFEWPCFNSIITVP